MHPAHPSCSSVRYQGVKDGDLPKLIGDDKKVRGSGSAVLSRARPLRERARFAQPGCLSQRVLTAPTTHAPAHPPRATHTLQTSGGTKGGKRGKKGGKTAAPAGGGAAGRTPPAYVTSKRDSPSADVPDGSTFAWASGPGSEDFRDLVFAARCKVPAATVDEALQAASVATVAAPGFLELPRCEQAVMLGCALGDALQAVILAAMSAEQRARIDELEAAHGSFFPPTQRAFWAPYGRLTDECVLVLWVVDKCALRDRFAGFAKGYEDLFTSLMTALDGTVLIVSAPLAGVAPCAGTGVASACCTLSAREAVCGLHDLAAMQKIMARELKLKPLGVLNASSALDKGVVGSGTARAAAAFGVDAWRVAHYNGMNCYHNCGQRGVLLVAWLECACAALQLQQPELVLALWTRAAVVFDEIAKTRPAKFFDLGAAQELWPKYKDLEEKGTPCVFWNAADDAYVKHNAIEELYKELRAAYASKPAMLVAFAARGWNAHDLDLAHDYLDDSIRAGACRGGPARACVGR